jgi:hypothetical protein
LVNDNLLVVEVEMKIELLTGQLVRRFFGWVAWLKNMQNFHSDKPMAAKFATHGRLNRLLCVRNSGFYMPAR